MNIALVSFDSVWENKESNQRLMDKKVQSLVELELDLIIFPEMTLTGFSMDSFNISEEFSDSETINFYKDLAIKYQRNLIAGVVLKDLTGIYNCCVYVSCRGELMNTYKKIHPFSFSGENEFYSSGKDLESVQTDNGIGLTVCYDLRFPELYQTLSKENFTIVNIASWPKKREEHWQTLLKARAIETQSFIIGVNRSGIDGNKLEYAGYSSIYSPLGEELIPIKKIDDISIFEFNPHIAQIVRQSFPIKQDRKTELYRNWLNSN